MCLLLHLLLLLLLLNDQHFIGGKFFLSLNPHKKFLSLQLVATVSRRMQITACTSIGTQNLNPNLNQNLNQNHWAGFQEVNGDRWARCGLGGSPTGWLTGHHVWAGLITPQPLSIRAFTSAWRQTRKERGSDPRSHVKPSKFESRYGVGHSSWLQQNPGGRTGAGAEIKSSHS